MVEENIERNGSDYVTSLEEPTSTLLNISIRQLLTLGMEVEGYNYAKTLSHDLHTKSKSMLSSLQVLLTNYPKLSTILDCKYLSTTIKSLNLCLEKLIKVYKRYDEISYYGRLTNLNSNLKVENRLTVVVNYLVEAVEASLNYQAQTEKDGKRIEILKNNNQTLLNQLPVLSEIESQVDSIRSLKSNIIRDMELIDDELDSSLLNDVEIIYDDVKKLAGSEPLESSTRHLVKRVYNTQTVVELVFDTDIDKLSKAELLKEVATLNLLKVSPNILKVFGLRTRPNYCGIIMEYCSLGSITNFINNDQFVKLGYSAEKLTEIKYKFSLNMCEAVSFLHVLGFLHKNITPNNLLITEHLDIKLSGFEFSKDEFNCMSSTQQDLDKFKFRWMPSEYFLKGDQMNSKSDVYSLVLSLIYLWDLSTPYLDLEDRSEVKAMLDNNIDWKFESIPTALQPQFIKCLNKEFSKRLNSREILELLEKHKPTKSSNCNPINTPITSINNDQDKFDLSMATFEAPSTPLTPNAKRSSNKPGYETRFLMNEEEELYNDADPFLPNFSKDSIPSIDSALNLHDANDKIEAYKQFQHLANFGDLQAFYYLGYYHYWGVPDFLEKDKSKGIEYFELAAASNNSDALDHLGIHFMDKANKYRRVNDDGNKDYKQLWAKRAFGYFRRSSDLGNVKAHYHLGDCYIKGLGTEKDRALGLKLIRKAADNGHVLAVNNLKKALAVSLNI